jgi:hypothetical protein
MKMDIRTERLVFHLGAESSRRKLQQGIRTTDCMRDGAERACPIHALLYAPYCSPDSSYLYLLYFLLLEIIPPSSQLITIFSVVVPSFLDQWERDGINEE